eukprot:3667038-Pyramimonas_sp.AAC.1
MKANSRRVRSAINRVKPAKHKTRGLGCEQNFSRTALRRQSSRERGRPASASQSSLDSADAARIGASCTSRTSGNKNSLKRASRPT